MLLDGIETLFVLAEKKTMSKTGSTLYISQSAVSKRIANLEKHLGKKLIEPKGRFVTLTSDGLALIKNVKPSFDELRGQLSEQKNYEHTDTILKIDCSETVIAGYFSDVLSNCYKRDLKVRLSTNHTPRIVENVKSGKAVMGLCAGYLIPHHGLLTYHLFDEPFYIVSSSLIDTLPDKIITTDLSNNANAYQSAILAGLSIEPLMELDSYHAAIQLALSGLAPALAPLSVIRSLKVPPSNCFQFNELELLHRPISLCVRKNNSRLERVREIIEAFMTSVQRLHLKSLTND